MGAIFTVGPYLYPGLAVAFYAVAPRMKPLLEENFTTILTERLKRGDYCFRDQVLDMCPECLRVEESSNGMQNIIEGTSLETVPSRRIVLAYRASFPNLEAIAALVAATCRSLPQGVVAVPDR